jgi:glycosyltransferase involved in cell wall biosynthesis
MLMICSFPPPINGQSAVNEALRRELADLSPRHVDIGPGGQHGIRYHLTRLRRVVGAMGKVLTAPRSQSVYLSSECGWGVVYLIALVAIVRLRGFERLVLHHHTYGYITEERRLHMLLIWLCGQSCEHVLLSPTMATAFLERYGQDHRHTILRNARFVDRLLVGGAAPEITRERLCSLGFIGRLDAEKGFDLFIALMERFAEDDRMRFVVAGDHCNSPFREKLAAVAARLGDRLDLRGFVSGRRKVDFYADIDLLLFPSLYRHEASPLVCYEALAMAVPVVASDIGAVGDIIDAECGVLVDVAPDMLSQMVRAVADLVDEPTRLEAMRVAARERFQELLSCSDDEIGGFRSTLIVGPMPRHGIAETSIGPQQFGRRDPRRSSSDPFQPGPTSGSVVADGRSPTLDERVSPRARGVMRKGRQWSAIGMGDRSA